MKTTLTKDDVIADLSRLLRVVANNERKLKRFQDLELSLIRCSSLDELFHKISSCLEPCLETRISGQLGPHKEVFVNWDAVTIVLVDPEYEIRRIMDGIGLTERVRSRVLFVNDRSDLARNQFQRLVPSSLLSPEIGLYLEKNHRRVFGEPETPLGSVAILPLIRNQAVTGILCVGSYDSDRFYHLANTDFLEYFSSVLSICIENTLNIEKLKLEGMTDGLTQIGNRRLFDKTIKKEIEHALDNKSPLACMVIDIDYFKKINDTMGHVVGDGVIRAVSVVIKDVVSNRGKVFRYGGEEFCVLARMPSSETQELAEQIRARICENEFCGQAGESFKITVSIGVASYFPVSMELNEHIVTPDEVVAGADAQLYQAKQTGRNKVCSAGDLPMVGDKTRNGILRI